MNDVQEAVTWPPQYHLKKHKRAKHVKLRATLTKGLQITIPERFNIKHLPEILEQNRDWIIKQLAALDDKKDESLPTQLHFQAINKTFTIFYVATDKKLTLLERPNLELILMGDISDPHKCKRMLLRWIKEVAKYHLTLQLKNKSNEVQLAYHKSNVREQKTLWGSCTRHKSINLNYKLIFLPIHLVDHIIIHELSHTQHLNHSKRFWNLVASLDNHWQENRAALRKADQFIPHWLSLIN